MVKLTLSFYFAGFAISQLICGPLSDGFGRKPAVYGFIGIYLVATLMGLFAPTIEGVIAARFLQGVGGGRRAGHGACHRARPLHHRERGPHHEPHHHDAEHRAVAVARARGIDHGSSRDGRRYSC